MNLPLASPSICGSCHADLAPGALVCPGCASLVHADELRRLATKADEAERAGDLTAALTAWRRAVELLPPGTTQRATLEARMRRLSAAVDGRGPPPEPLQGAARGGPGKKAGAAAGVGAVGLALLKSKALLGLLLGNGKLLLLGLLKLPTLLSMLVYLHWFGSGGGVALGIVASIYVHEMGHVAALRRYGIDASAPMFIPGFGAVVRLRQYPTDAHEEARTGLAGPLWGLFAVVVAGVVSLVFGWSAAALVASWSASINLFNLIAVWQLDGARGLKALSQSQRWAVGAVALACGLGLHEWMPAVVGAVALGRSGKASSHPAGDPGMFALFLALVVSLSVCARFFDGG